MYLLDTNHCSQAMRGHPVMIERLADVTAVPVRTCVIVRAELVYMAYHSARVQENLILALAFLSSFAIYPIDEVSADHYGHLKAALLDRFGPKERAKRRHFDLRDLGFSDNDLWIAAIALRHDLIVVSSDKDFARIAEVSDLRHESWLTESSEVE
jgi:tRNA(fMet)-specific endonuclease VapC